MDDSIQIKKQIDDYLDELKQFEKIPLEYVMNSRELINFLAKLNIFCSRNAGYY